MPELITVLATYHRTDFSYPGCSELPPEMSANVKAIYRRCSIIMSIECKESSGPAKYYICEILKDKNTNRVFQDNC